MSAPEYTCNVVWGQHHEHACVVAVQLREVAPHRYAREPHADAHRCACGATR